LHKLLTFFLAAVNLFRAATNFSSLTSAMLETIMDLLQDIRRSLIGSVEHDWSQHTALSCAALAILRNKQMKLQ
jgi:hypothetical protein